ncbi:NnrU family protein [Pseudooceanicola batsensis HTCC2597]|uniref:NnrU family protein n=1 Tax=Pseudooceanicola batsensis (strain ATCC BAA-863 / DSM 15984 / KCTC 12145 / HTCC2597) TaxID=252305 RepID=A3TV37_PSEBH|nr:NnrU family protein [Pseudooceanicola batsensis]EAQ04383.1 NnrU family protein [Pseudooceanicola batsensis HTCC2597]
MLLLVLGVLLWWAAHLFKRVAPGPRARMGTAGKGAVALALVVSIVLMIFGYRAAEGAFFWGRHPATVGINNLMMVAALYLTSPGPKKGALFYRMRHPMLTGFLLWTLAHLLVNGDVPSFVLFGGLGLWAVVEMIVINRSDPDWSPPAKGSIAKDGMFFAISVLLLLVIGWIHTWLGYPTFG